MRSSKECLAKARELDDRAAECPLGEMQDGFTNMANHWRRLADCAPLVEVVCRPLP